jgi:hypothetical protein
MKFRSPSGSLSGVTRTIKGKIYPSVDGDRDPDNLQHWNWQYTYKEKIPNKGFRSRSVSVPRAKVSEVRSMLTSGSSISEIVAFLGRKLNTPE